MFGGVTPESFATFDVAFFTLLLVTAGGPDPALPISVVVSSAAFSSGCMRAQCGAGEPWPEALPRLKEDGSASWRVMSFCGCYIVVSTWLVLQVLPEQRCHRDYGQAIFRLTDASFMPTEG